MKRQKRNPTDRAQARGYQTGASGGSWDMCPFASGEARERWMAGWREAREDHWNGFNSKAQAQKISNF
ncbi:MAG TPA: ribosome modulation factor [Cellvibrionaceae bacterium]|jgi:ribosome modulation factor|nr:ribosome modulation factor [Cellvibrionaceae bacterium]HMW73768.1 ribosome modulation factor [Cellvibrionaceae bacterium]HMY40183.1 ribosome modulation factor [Marinagarivorans sp.]HNG61762.1 ribosome modulation factor [Cellvibrionaceae bacterium]